MSRLKRILEIWRLFGIWDKLTWLTIFPPFKGWDVGCGYCAKEEQALKDRHCQRFLDVGGKCGVLE